MSFYRDVAGAIADALEARVVGLQAEGRPPESVGHFPTTLVLPEGFDPRFAFGGDVMPTRWRLVTLLASGDAPGGEAQLDDMLDATALATSVVRALRADPTLDGTVDTSEVASLEKIGRRAFGGGDYFGFDVLLDVTGREDLARIVASAVVVASNAENGWPQTGNNVWVLDNAADDVQIQAAIDALQ